MVNEKDEHSSYSQINTVLDKMIEIKQSENKVSFAKKCFLMTSCIASIVILVMLCVIFYKNSFSIESLISLLLAFFSIFISVFFYFKADEASNRFYKTSYDFMKDVSVTLGKIEERFGEKLNSLNDKVAHLSVAKEEKKEELETVEDEKQKMIDDLMQKAKLNSQEKREYRNKLRRQDQQILALKNELAHMRHMEMFCDNENDEISQTLKAFLNARDVAMMKHLQVSQFPESLKDKLHTLGILDDAGNLTQDGKFFLGNT